MIEWYNRALFDNDIEFNLNLVYYLQSGNDLLENLLRKYNFVNYLIAKNSGGYSRYGMCKGI